MHHGMVLAASRSECGPSGRRQSAWYTWRHHGVLAAARVGGKSSGRKPPKTNDQPNRSASVVRPVAATKAANSSFVTVVALIANEVSVTSRTGSSPSSG